MEVKLDKRYPVAASPEQAWAVLSDIRATASCMPGAAITEQVDDTHYKGTVKSKVGPATMQFGGEIEVLGLDASSRSMRMLGKGSDRGGSSASMELAARIESGEAPGSSVLVGEATIIVSGKLAQFGSRLLVPISDALLAQFATQFSAAAQAVPATSTAAVTEATAATDATASAASTASAAAPAAPAVAKAGAELNALALMWAVIKGWLGSLFGGKGAGSGAGKA
jgi:carbon monoxide dehydrogenase subunit G